MFGFTHPPTILHVTVFELVAVAFIRSGLVFFFPLMSSNQANDYGSLRVKQLKVKFTGRLKLSDYPCYGNLTNSSTE